ncbi:Rieske domain-containing protein-like protein, partial [Dinothrombium tinctorium]
MFEQLCIYAFQLFAFGVVVDYAIPILLFVLLISLLVTVKLNICRDFRLPENVVRKKFGDNSLPLFPNGWIPVIESQCVKQSKITAAQVCGEEVIVFRNSFGKVCVLDAYCPHLGAKFSPGGTIVKDCDNDCIRCPFHGWIFRANDGACVKVPYSKDEKAPPGVKLKVWTSIEVNDFIYVWYHAD